MAGIDTGQLFIIW